LPAESFRAGTFHALQHGIDQLARGIWDECERIAASLDRMKIETYTEDHG
jgi:hypothetical protein